MIVLRHSVKTNKQTTITLWSPTNYSHFISYNGFCCRTIELENGWVVHTSPGSLCCGTAVILKPANPVFCPENSFICWNYVQSCVHGQLKKLRNRTIFGAEEELATVVLANSFWAWTRYGNRAFGQDRPSWCWAVSECVNSVCWAHESNPLSLSGEERLGLAKWVLLK